jgi:hypothetical protein
MRIRGALLVLAMSTACHEGANTVRPQDAASEKVMGPKIDRCAVVTGADRDKCNQMKAEARKYISGLNVNDNFCVEGGFGEEPGPECKARGQIIDGDTEGFLVKIHDPVAGSHWQGYADKNIWIANEALIDQYVVDRGFH